MPVDNELYTRLGSTWWNEREPLSLLRTGLNPARFGYFREVIERRRIEPAGLRVLDVGCGGGFLAEEFARLGCRVTGIDPSETSLATARAHAEQSGLAIAYRAGAGEQLPFVDAIFDLVTCCDVLEHVDDLDRVIAEIGRVLRPGGIFFFDTLNRTLLSRFVLITLVQDLGGLGLKHLHDWRMFITPRELRRLMARHGLRPLGFAGIRPSAGPLTLLLLVISLKRGRLSYGEFGRRLALRRGRNLSISYMGYALKCRPSCEPG